MRAQGNKPVFAGNAWRNTRVGCSTFTCSGRETFNTERLSTEREKNLGYYSSLAKVELREKVGLRRKVRFKIETSAITYTAGTRTPLRRLWFRPREIWETARDLHYDIANETILLDSTPVQAANFPVDRFTRNQAILRDWIRKLTLEVLDPEVDSLYGDWRENNIPARSVLSTIHGDQRQYMEQLSRPPCTGVPHPSRTATP